MAFWRLRVFYGWYVVAATFAITFGIAFAIVYTVFERLNWPFFTYHPAVGKVDFWMHPPRSGQGPSGQSWRSDRTCNCASPVATSALTYSGVD